MDKNIAALMREGTRTVQVSFDQVAEEFDDLDPPNRFAAQKAKSPSTKQYTYVTDLPLAIGDCVVVEARGLFNVAFVRGVDDDAKIEPNSDTTYKWVVAKVDLEGYAANMAKNREIADAVSNAYRNNLRRSNKHNHRSIMCQLRSNVRLNKHQRLRSPRHSHGAHQSLRHNNLLALQAPHHKALHCTNYWNAPSKLKAS